MAIIGGLLLSQMLTLYTTPVVYLSLDRMRVKWLRAHGKLEGERQAESFG
jgi:multidrug efflux pump